MQDTVTRILNIGKDFSTYPIGRYPSDGPHNGETFREEYLRPALESLKEGQKLTVVLDDADGYGSSFLTEGFAGIVKHGYMSSDELLNKITFEYSNEDYEFFRDRIIAYISAAVPE